ncbi:CGNR zinc finger domain-containing protein [Nocardiopsis eucommiae]|uniref:CGNR zinc finger domain-containing protein n=1 Tax=Nocardiopsis eucommiae TaxID=2831970 RepID=A0A975QLV1_9ACTN|nr:CGNR zinc finger domain-containing protein [Nocardiopsis eucommiae]
MERPPAAERVELFTNTFDLESGRDELSTPEELTHWLREHGLVGGGTRADAADHRAFLDLRAGLRAALDGTAADPHALARADTVLAELPLLASLDRTLVPDPELSPARRACAVLALDWVRLATTGEVVRLKRCAEHTCLWVFWDGSKNQSRRWCSMRVCGNRTKSRRHTAKERRAREDG